MIVVDLEKKELEEIGNKLKHCLWIDLYNYQPNTKKIYFIYKQLENLGLDNTYDEIAKKIEKYYKARNKNNHIKTFQTIFNFPYTHEILEIFSLSYRTAIIPDDIKREKSIEFFEILKQAYPIEKLKITLQTCYEFMNEIYQPSYLDNEWVIYLSAIETKFLRQLVKEKNPYYKEVEYLFYLLDPNLKRRKPHGILNDHIEQNGVEYGSKEEGTDEKGEEGLGRNRLIGNEEKNGETLLTNRIPIKEGEYLHVKEIITILNEMFIPEPIEKELYQAEERHPLVKNFIISHSSYNNAVVQTDLKNPDAVKALKIQRDSMKFFGQKIINEYEGKIKETKDSLSYLINRSTIIK